MGFLVLYRAAVLVAVRVMSTEDYFVRVYCETEGDQLLFSRCGPRLKMCLRGMCAHACPRCSWSLYSVEFSRDRGMLGLSVSVSVPRFPSPFLSISFTHFFSLFTSLFLMLSSFSLFLFLSNTHTHTHLSHSWKSFPLSNKLK